MKQPIVRSGLAGLAIKAIVFLVGGGATINGLVVYCVILIIMIIISFEGLCCFRGIVFVALRQAMADTLISGGLGPGDGDCGFA